MTTTTPERPYQTIPDATYEDYLLSLAKDYVDACRCPACRIVRRAATAERRAAELERRVAELEEALRNLRNAASGVYDFGAAHSSRSEFEKAASAADEILAKGHEQ